MPTRTSYANGEFCWVDLASHDMQSAKEFYCSLFGWTCETMDTQGGPPYAQFSKDGKGVGGLGELNDEMKSQGIPPVWNSYINVEDIEGIVDRAKELGATITVPVMQVLDAGSLAYFMDPTGASVGLWKKNQHFGAELVNEPNTFCWNELTTRDLDKAKVFFDSLFGWNCIDHQASPVRYFLIQMNGENKGGMLQMTEEWGEIPAHWAVYFMVDDVQATADKVKELGGTVRVPPFDTEVGPISVLADPQGAGFSVIKLKQTS